MTLKGLLGAALLCLAESVAAQSTKSDAMDEYREQFRNYVGSWEASANQILQEAVAGLTAAERLKVPSGLKVRVGWSHSSGSANSITGCGTLGQPASLDPSTVTIWLCEEGTRTVAALLQVVLASDMAARFVALETHQGQMSDPSPAMLETYNRNYKKWGKPAVEYLMARYIDQVNGPILKRFAPRSCLGYVVAYLAVHDQVNSGSIVCSRENPDAEMESRAAAWFGALLGKGAQQMLQVVGVPASAPVVVSPEGIDRYGSGLLQRVIGYFVLHELGHLVVDGGRVPANATNDMHVAAEVVADRFAFDGRFGAMELKPFVMVSLSIYWHDLAAYAAGPGANTAMIAARSKTTETLMCDESRAWFESPNPTVNERLKELQKKSCATDGRSAGQPHADR